MTTAASFLRLAVVLLVGLFSGGIALAFPADGELIFISGKVVGPDGKPVPEAKLFLFDSEEEAGAGEGSRRGGRFRV